MLEQETISSLPLLRQASKKEVIKILDGDFRPEVTPQSVVSVLNPEIIQDSKKKWLSEIGEKVSQIKKKIFFQEELQEHKKLTTQCHALHTNLSNKQVMLFFGSINLLGPLAALLFINNYIYVKNHFSGSGLLWLVMEFLALFLATPFLSMLPSCIMTQTFWRKQSKEIIHLRNAQHKLESNWSELAQKRSDFKSIMQEIEQYETEITENSVKSQSYQKWKEACTYLKKMLKSETVNANPELKYNANQEIFVKDDSFLKAILAFNRATQNLKPE